MEPSILNPAIPYLGIVNGFRPGQIVRVQGRVNHNSHGFKIELLCGSNPNHDDVALHFNPRFSESVVIRNSRSYSTWGTEERQGGVFPFSRGQVFEVLILCERLHFKVTNTLVSCLFKKKFVSSNSFTSSRLFQYRIMDLPNIKKADKRKLSRSSTPANKKKKVPDWILRPEKDAADMDDADLDKFAHQVVRLVGEKIPNSKYRFEWTNIPPEENAVGLTFEPDENGIVLVQLDKTFHRNKPRNELLDSVMHEGAHVVTYLLNPEEKASHGKNFRKYVGTLERKMQFKIKVTWTKADEREPRDGRRRRCHHKQQIHILGEGQNAMGLQWLVAMGKAIADGKAIAHLALQRKTGARGLRAVMEIVLRDPMFEIPGSDVTSVHITEGVVHGNFNPIYTRTARRTESSNESDGGNDHDKNAHSIDDEEYELKRRL